MQQKTAHRRIRLIVFFWFVISLLLPSNPSMAQSRTHTSSNMTTPSLSSMPDRQPPAIDVAFIPNRGQLDSDVTYEALLAHSNVQFKPDALAYTLRQVSPTHTPTQNEPHKESYHLTMNFLETATPVVTATQQVPGIFNDYRASDPSRWRSGLLRYQQITYHELYPGIDLIYTFDGANLKSTYVVTPAMNPTIIRWSYTNAVPTLASDGALVLNDLTMTPIMTESAPIAWQEIAGEHIPIHVVYQLDPNGGVGFTVGRYNPTYPLIIDPTMTSTIINNVRASAMDRDDQGNVYIAGCIDDFTTVRKYAADTKTLMYETQGTEFTCGNDIAVDAQGGVGVVSGRGYGSPDIAVYLRLTASGAMVCSPIELAAGNGASVHRILYNPANSRMYVVWASGSNGTSLTTFNGCTQTSSTAFNGFGPGMTVDADGTLYYTVASGSGANLVQKPLNSPQHSFATDGDGYVAVNDLYIVIAGWTPIGSFIAKHLHSGDFVGSYSLPIDTSITALALDSLGMISMSGSTQSTAFPLAGSTTALDNNRTNGYVLKLDLQPLQATLMYSVLIPHHQDGDYGSSVSDIGLTNNQLVFVGHYTTGAAETDQNAYSRIGILQSTNLSATFEKFTTLPINQQGQEYLTVNADSGWYEQPYISYTLTIVNDTPSPQTMSISSPARESQHISMWNISTGVKEVLSFDLTIPAHQSMIIPIGIWAQPHLERNITPEIWIRPQAPDQPYIWLYGVPLQIPAAFIRPVVVVPGFISSMPDPIHGGYQLDPTFGMYDGLIHYLNVMGYEDNLSLIDFAYPWYGQSINKPNDLHDLATDLDDRLDTWWNTRPKKPYIRDDSFDVIAHSTGGLITRYYGSKLGGMSKMHSVFFVAVPHRGTPLAYLMYEGLDPQMVFDFEDQVSRLMTMGLAIKAGCKTTSSSSIIPLAGNEEIYTYLHGVPCVHTEYPSGKKTVGPPQPGIPLLRQLLPSSAAPDYLTLAGGIVPPKIPNPVVDDLDLRAAAFANTIQAQGGHIYSLFSTKRDLVTHLNVGPDPLANPLWELATHVPNGWNASLTREDRAKLYKPNKTDDTDDTVPIQSADFAAISGSSFVQTIKFGFPNNTPINNSTVLGGRDVSHTAYFNTPHTLKHIVGRLVDPTPTDQFLRYLPEPLDLKNSYDLSTVLAGIALIVNECPVSMLITDAHGRRIGTTPDGLSVNEIPGGVYTGKELNTPEMIWFPSEATHPYTLTITGLEAEPYKIHGYHITTNITPTHTQRVGLWDGVLQSGEILTTTAVFSRPLTDSVLLLDPGLSSTTKSLYTAHLPLTTTVTPWDLQSQGIPSINTLFPYDAVLWAGEVTHTLDLQLLSNLNGYLNLGGKVLIMGSNNDFDTSLTPLITSTLGIQTILTATTSTHIDGQDILAGLDLDLSTNGNPSASSFQPVGTSQSIGRYVNGDGIGHTALTKSMTYLGGRLVVGGFGLEQVISPDQQTHLLDRVFNWLQAGETAHDPDPVLLADIVSGAGSSIVQPNAMVTISDTTFFLANDGVHGTELWQTNGLRGGTWMVRDIRLGSASAGITSLVASNGVLFFTANDGITGPELWKSDGTEAGTVLVADLWEGSDGGAPSVLTDVQGTLFFSGFDGNSGIELWKTDGTITGTVQVKDIISGAGSSNPLNFKAVGQQLFFTTTGTGTGLWVSDGTAVGTRLVKGFDNASQLPSQPQFAAMEATLFFTLQTAAGIELWTSDGTSSGTHLVADIAPGSASSTPQQLTVFNKKLFFRATDGSSGTELWATDGTSTGTVQVIDLASGSASSSPSGLTVISNTLFFSASNGSTGNELWKSDGTSSGTQIVLDINPGTNGSLPTNLTAAHGHLFFSATLGTTGRELWYSDGTATGTRLINDQRYGMLGSTPSLITPHPRGVIVMLNDGIVGVEPWGITLP